MTDQWQADRTGLRVLRFLDGGNAHLSGAASPGLILLGRGEKGTLAVDAALLASLEKSGMAARRDQSLSITPAGRRALASSAAQRREPLLAQPRETGGAVIEAEDGYEAVTVNWSESPLGLLHRRRGKDGKAFIDVREFRAGERLRTDYTRGQMMPRLGVNWDTAGSAGRRRGEAGGAVELTQAALAARRRVEKAIEAVGPELAGVLIDVCCFLKGVEQVESERCWPARSAKVMLKSALGALARHYDPAREAKTGRDARATILHWGVEDYRPTMMRP